MELKSLSGSLNRILEKCVLCPHKCRADRTAGEDGFCRAKNEPVMSSAVPHHGEEPPVSGRSGSGTIFFTHCNMKCVYCQNYQISQQPGGIKESISGLAGHMIRLQDSGCHNINLVSPTIWIPQIIEAVIHARKRGLKIPLVYNTGGYDNPEIIKMLSGIIDIYMPDMRYSTNDMAEKYSLVENYVTNNRDSVKEMYRQVGGLELDRDQIAKRGLLIRLLVLPEDIGGIKKTLDFIKSEFSTDVYLSIMAQYHPAYRAGRFSALGRRVTAGEYLDIVKYAEKKGFDFGWTQDLVSPDPEEDLFIPDFNNKKIFKYYRKKENNS